MNPNKLSQIKLHCTFIKGGSQTFHKHKQKLKNKKGGILKVESQVIYPSHKGFTKLNPKPGHLGHAPSS
jgi:hypothetical protein